MAEARTREIAATARKLLEDEGPDALTMRRIADALGIKAPSLYKHVPDKAALEALIVADAMLEMTELTEQALAEAAAELAEADAVADAAAADRGLPRGLPSPDRLAVIGAAYRAYAIAHPHLYRLMTYRPLGRDLLPEGLEDRAAKPIVEAVGRDAARARAAWAFAHGMVSLEIEGRFPPDADLDAAWLAGIGSFASPPPAAAPGAPRSRPQDTEPTE